MSQVPSVIHKKSRDLMKGLIWTETMPDDATMLHADCQQPDSALVSIWFRFCPQRTKVMGEKHVTLVAVETGKEALIADFSYLSTVKMLEGKYVVHIYYKEVY